MNPGTSGAPISGIDKIGIVHYSALARFPRFHAPEGDGGVSGRLVDRNGFGGLQTPQKGMQALASQVELLGQSVLGELRLTRPDLDRPTEALVSPTTNAHRRKQGEEDGGVGDWIPVGVLGHAQHPQDLVSGESKVDRDHVARGKKR